MAEAQKSYLYVNVCDSILITSVNGDYTAYGIRSISSDPLFPKYTFLTRRPYSDFDDLRQLLVSRHGDMQVPDIPPRVTPEDEFKDDIIKIRIRGFQQFINRLLSINELKRDPSLQLFIQSHKTMAQISEEVEFNAQQKAINSNRQTREMTTRYTHDAEQPSSPDSAASGPSTDEYIFDMDDLD